MARSDETQKVWKEAFSSQDDDSDGLISVGKLETLLKSIGCNPSEEDVQKVISKSNKTVDDKIDFDEFALMMDTYEQIQVEEMMLQTFRVVDQDGDGFISAQELQSAMSDMGENVTEEEVKTMIESADLDLDGQINFKVSNMKGRIFLASKRNFETVTRLE
ncbi:calmodulin-beta isoform X1 [Magallana gigas]|uniref:calmodulin-beta isoform X1 n=1 Tax=Magallana gigas TaxID=29159 RepID=UPI003341F397